MIKEKQLVPGRVLLRSVAVPYVNKFGYHDFRNVWVPCMVVAYQPDIKRRHARKTAPVEGWELLVLWWGEVRRPIEQVRIRPDQMDWKAASF